MSINFHKNNICLNFIVFNLKSELALNDNMYISPDERIRI